MRKTQRGFYTLVGWTTWKAVKWYLAGKLGMRHPHRKRRIAGLLVLGTVAAGGVAAVVSSRSDDQRA